MFLTQICVLGGANSFGHLHFTSKHFSACSSCSSIIKAFLLTVKDTEISFLLLDLLDLHDYCLLNLSAARENSVSGGL